MAKPGPTPKTWIDPELNSHVWVDPNRFRMQQGYVSLPKAIYEICDNLSKRSEWGHHAYFELKEPGHVIVHPMDPFGRTLIGIWRALRDEFDRGSDELESSLASFAGRFIRTNISNSKINFFDRVVQFMGAGDEEYSEVILIAFKDRIEFWSDERFKSVNMDFEIAAFDELATKDA